MAVEKTCEHCDGTGILEGESCGYCGGDGLQPLIACKLEQTVNYVWTLYDYLRILQGKSFTNNIVATYKILEATDITEYGNLSDSNKNAYNMILQCGVTDLTDGTVIRANLWAMFDSESTTRAALITLLGE